MARPFRWFALLVVALALVTSFTTPGLARIVRGTFGTDPAQCANRLNGSNSPSNDCTGGAWIKGNLNRNNSLYREGDFVPFRTPVTGLVAGRTYTLRIGYDAVQSGLHAYDYLGSFDDSAAPGQQIVPCDGIGGTAGPNRCGDTPSTLAVPIDTATTFPPGASQAAGSFSAWGGKLQDAKYVNPLPIGVNTPGTVERAIDVTFTAAGGTVVLAWGGHLASVLDWGAGNTFISAASGSSFHMRLKQVQESGQPPETIGNQELSLQAAALAPQPAPFTTQVSTTSITTEQTVVDTATLTAVGGKPVTGEVQFFICGPEASATAAACLQGGSRVGGPQVVALSPPPSGPNGQASIAFPQPGEGPIEPGHYCFRAEYTPSAIAEYSPAVHPSTVPVDAECFVVTLPPPRLTVTKLCDPANDPGHFNLLVNGAPHGGAAGTNVPCGGTTGAIQVSPGSYTVSEGAGTGTDLGNYTSTIGGDCAPDGSITLALGDSAVCTITNVRKPAPPPAELTVHKICDPTDDPGQFAIHIDGPHVSALDIATLGCGDSVGPVQLAPGSYTVSETGVPPTNLSDYTTVISGDCAPADGSITLAPGQSGECTFTNTRNPPPATTLRIDKLCDPSADPGLFNLLVDGAPLGGVAGTDVPCGGTTGVIQIAPGSYTVGESAGTGTSLGNYTSTIGGDCAANGAITLALGDTATCTITNVRNAAPPPAELTVHKICDPTDDPGQFEIHIDGPNVSALDIATLACGEAVGPVQLAPGSYTVSEAGVPPTSLTDYTTVIDGDCAANGSITLAAGDSATCTITNTRNPPPTTTLRIVKLCDPADDPGLFDLLVDSTPLGGTAGTDVACGGTTGAITVNPGSYTVSEGAGTGTDLGNYTSTIDGDCAANGSITLAAGDSAVCTITNVHNAAPPPAELTVHKICDPADDPGQFEIHLDGPNLRGRSTATVACGDSVGPVPVAPGSYTVSEAGVPPTDLTDYTTVIDGDCAANGSITLAAGDSATCTVTNTRIPPKTTLTVRKVCFPVGDGGHFRVGIFTVDGRPLHRVVLTCHGTTGAVQVHPGTYVVRERGANGTDLSEYNRFIGGDCLSNGTVTVQAGDHARCRIVNVHKGTGPKPAELTVIKICVPPDDGGLFNLTVDAQTQADVACGDSFGPVAVPPGEHRVSESAGTGTSLGDYTTTIGGACAADGSVTLAAGQQATCAITNVRKGPLPPELPATVEIQKKCLPAGTKGRFQLEFDEHVFYLACGESTGPVVVPPGDHRVGEVAVGLITSRFTTTIGGDCAPDGSFTLTAGDHVTCVVTNTHEAPIRPPKPPPACYTLSAKPRTAIAGKRVRLVARVHLGRRPVRGVQVFAAGPGVSGVRTTGANGRAVFLLTPRSRGILRVSIRKAFDCPKRPPKKIGIRGVGTPPVTG